MGKVMMNLLLGLSCMFILESQSFTRAETTLVAQLYFNRELNNIVFYNESVYVVGDGQLNMLTSDLETVAKVSTCVGNADPNACHNVNKILLLNGDKDALILCGTGNMGTCQVRPLTNISLTTNGNNLGEDTIRVSNNTNRPAVALINDEDQNLSIGVTFGPNLKPVSTSTANELSYKYALSTRKPTSPFGMIPQKNIILSIQKIDDEPSSVKPLENFLIYYKTAFQNDNFSYFFTNQKKLVGDQKFVSKMVRVCQGDIEYSSYADIVIKCSKDGRSYNLLQDAVIIEPGKTPGFEAGDRIFVGTFTSADNPEDVSGDSAICVEKLSVLNDAIMAAKEETISCSHGDISDNQRYLKKGWTCNSTIYKPAFALCAKIPSYKYIIGQTGHQMTVVYTLSADHGYMSTVSGHVVSSTDTVVIQAGTSRGYFILMNLDSLDKDLFMFEKLRVQKGSTVRKIYTRGGNSTDPTFIMTRSKVLKYDQTNCSQFTSCKKMIVNRNPYCGWCVYLGRSTTREACPEQGANHWLSSLTSCLSIHAAHQGQEANSQQGQVRLTVSDLPQKLNGDKYECVFRIGPKRLLSGPATQSDDGTLLCVTPSMAQPAHVTLELKVITGGIPVLLGEVPFLYYKCEQYLRCGECTSTVGASCVWCPQSVRCQSSCSTETSVDMKSECLHLLNDTGNTRYIPSDIQSTVEFELSGTILPDMNMFCYVPEINMIQDAKMNVEKVTCGLKLPLPVSVAKKEYKVILRYGTKQSRSRNADIDDEFSNYVTVYRCQNLARDCSQCQGLNSTRYQCDWCESGSCGYKDDQCKPTSQCPAPVITKVNPIDAPLRGITVVTLFGSNLGSNATQVESVTLAGVSCTYLEQTEDFAVAGDFEEQVPDRLSCQAGEADDSSIGVSGPVQVTVNKQSSSGSVTFTYQKPELTSMSPSSGPLIGGTLVTFSGDHLNIGNRNVHISFGGQHPLDDCTVQEHSDDLATIGCKVPSGLTRNFTNFRLTYGEGGGGDDFKWQYLLLANPAVERISPKKTILSGGTKIIVSGTHLNHAHQGTMYATYSGLVTTGSCTIMSNNMVECHAPVAPRSVIEDLQGKLPDQSKRRRRNVPCQCVEVSIGVQLDGMMYNDTVQYFPDPQFDHFTDEGAIHKYDSSAQRLTLMGKFLDLVIEKDDYQVTIGAEPCTVVELTETTLTFVTPKDQPDPVASGLNFPEVNVTIGNLQMNIGYIEYEENIEMIIIIAVVAALVLVGLIVGITKYRKQGKQKLVLERKYKDIEMEIKRVAREEFHDMHTTMSTVNKNLVQQGFPYHKYQQFASNIMFASYSDHGVSKIKLTEDMKKPTQTALQELEELVLNKTFLTSVISTMEREKRFLHRERASLAGNLCAVLIGRMDYIQEVLKDLLKDLVQDAISNNKHKTLFRTCERITENLLSNWLSLNMYSHFKETSGSKLYMLYMAMLKTIESGPIDAITHDVKYTLCEEKLLKKWDTTKEEGSDVKFEAKPLTMHVVVDNGEQIYECRALDCDTITQVKAKCLTQIYVNYPASQLDVDPNELNLEWHAGYSGSLSLKDEDASSIVDGRWKRLNTLAHYSVKDNCKMALIDPKCVEGNDTDNYVNLPEVNVTESHSHLYANRMSGEGSAPSSPHDEENLLLQTPWHLVKRSDETAEQTERSVLEDLYLNRLFTTKQSILDYMNKLFDAILDETHCPPPTKFLYDFLDELGENSKVDPEIIHAWKSHSYPIRVWGTLLKQPKKLFDINVPVYVEDSLDIIAQVFIESFSVTPQKFTKDSSPQKLIFHSEMNQYREKVKQFYSGVSNVQQTSDDLKNYLGNVNSHQQSFKKLTYLNKLFDQLKPFTEQILEGLEEIDEKLSRKFDDVINKLNPSEDNDDAE